MHNSEVSSWFVFQTNQEPANIGLHPSEEDVLFNYIIDSFQLINGLILWHGAREKDVMLMHMLIESLTKPKDMIFDVNASTSTLSLYLKLKQ